MHFYFGGCRYHSLGAARGISFVFSGTARKGSTSCALSRLPADPPGPLANWGSNPQPLTQPPLPSCSRAGTVSPAVLASTSESFYSSFSNSYSSFASLARRSRSGLWVWAFRGYSSFLVAPWRVEWRCLCSSQSDFWTESDRFSRPACSCRAVLETSLATSPDLWCGHG